MKIKSIKNIKNVGTFKNCQGSNSRFEKLNFIYGLNTYGKTTLVDILQSLKNNDPNIINSRKTIPTDNEEQKIELSIKYDNENSEKTISFQNGSWNEKISNIEIFNERFIEDNVFTNSNITYPNKENFSRFILGKEGVDLANKIATKKKELVDKKKNKNARLPDFIKNKSDTDIDKFINISVEGLNKNNIEKENLEAKNNLNTEQENLQNPQRINNLPVIKKKKISEFSILNYLQEINNLLQKSYPDIQKEILDKFHLHIKENFKNADEAENWIKEGWGNIKNNDCNFCGQSLENAKELMNAYHHYFNEAYSEFINEIEINLKKNFDDANKENFNLKNNFLIIFHDSQKYKDFIRENDFEKLLAEFKTKIDLLDEEKLGDMKQKTLKSVEIKINEKNKKPHAVITRIDYSQFQEEIATYKNCLSEIADIIQKIETKTEIFKNQYKNTSDIKKKIDSLDEKITQLNTKIKRIENDGAIKYYIQEKGNIKSLDKEVEQLKWQLSASQTDFLKNYFNEVNRLFRNFGSQNFTLEKEENRQGYHPVYSLKVKFHNEAIPSNKLKSVFSTSDKRALALAIFWSKISLKEKEEQKKIVVVLDDPITSFDDNRIKNTIDLFKEYLKNLSQIIILTHYPGFIKNFCDKKALKDGQNKFYEIDKAGKPSLFKELEEDFALSNYAKKFNEIHNFINGKTDKYGIEGFRVFFEYLYIPTIFAKQLSEYANLSSLKDVIDKIFKEDDSNREKFHRMREEMNIDNHIFKDMTIEDIRNYLRTTMDYLYSFKFNTHQ